MAGGMTSRSDRGSPAGPPAPRGGETMLQAAAIVATGAAAVALVAGIGTYLYIRFTQHRRNPPGAGGKPPAGAGGAPSGQ